MLRMVLAAFVTILCALPAFGDDLERLREAGIVRIGICFGAEPVGFKDSSGTPRGYDVDVATLMAEAMGVEPEFVEVTVPSRIGDLLAGRIDIIACGITATPQRALQIDFSFPYLRTGLKFLVRRDGSVREMDDVGAGTRVLVGRDSTGDRLMNQRAPEAQFVYVDTPSDAALLMLRGEGDVYVNDSLIVDYIAKAHVDALEVPPRTYSFDAISFGVRKGNPDLLRWLDLFSSVFVSSGQYAEVYGRWWGGEPPPLTPVW